MRSPSFMLVLAAALAALGAARADTVTLKPAVHMLGLWVDGIVSDGKSLFVVETGQSSLAQLDAKFRLTRRIKLVGIPDKIDIGHDGALYMLLQVENDVKLWQQPPGNGGRAIATLDPKGCASGLAVGSGAFAWIVGGCNGDNNAALLKVDLKTGASAKVALGAGAGGYLLVRQGKVWVGLDKLVVIDETTLAMQTLDVSSKFGNDAAFGPLAASEGTLYAGVDGGDTRLVIAIDPATLQETARTAVDARISVITADARHVVAASEEGKLFVLAAGTLKLERIINLAVPKVEPRALMIRGDDLLITDFRMENPPERGALLVLRDWRPAAGFDMSKLGYGSLFLGDFMPLISSSPRLKKEIDAALAAAKKKPDEQLCELPRFPGPWENLHGEHVVPYVCNIGTKWLQIDATLKVSGPKGEVYETETPTALKRANRISQTQPTWTWSDADPRKQK